MVGELAQRGNACFLGEQLQHVVAERLVVVDEHAHGAAKVDLAAFR